VLLTEEVVERLRANALGEGGVPARFLLGVGGEQVGLAASHD
jgi:hypothetical protein